MKYYYGLMLGLPYVVCEFPDWLDVEDVSEALDFSFSTCEYVEEDAEIEPIFNLLAPDIFIISRKRTEEGLLFIKPEMFQIFSKQTLKNIIKEWKRMNRSVSLVEEIEENLDYYIESASIEDIIR